MKKYGFLLCTLICSVAMGQSNVPIKCNKEYTRAHLNAADSDVYKITLTKDKYYSLLAQNKGVNITVSLLDEKGKIIKNDASFSETDPAHINFSPDKTEIYSINVRLKKEDTIQVKEGTYTLQISTPPEKLQIYSKADLLQDFEILKNAYLETKVGLWYNSYVQFDSFCKVQQSKIKGPMNAIDFYKMVAPLTAFTKEGHSSIHLSNETNLYGYQNFKYLPFLVKIIGGRICLLNDIENFKVKGWQLASINGISADSILQTFINTEPSDGYNLTSKYHWIEASFAHYFSRYFENTSSHFSLQLIDPATQQKKDIAEVQSVDWKAYSKLSKQVSKDIPGYSYNDVSSLKIDTANSIAILTFNDFGLEAYENGREGFKKLLKNYFQTIADLKLNNLIIDIRRNEGGSQGVEDHLMSYLETEAYAKYKFVEIPAFDYSFIKYSDLSTQKSKDNFEKKLRAQFYQEKDGRYLDIKGIFKSDPPQANAFKGAIYILTSGLTFSGASEFAALAKNYSNAKFVGEETGGGYYGNTSGEFINFTLPNTKLHGRIPLCKFVIVPKENDIPFGRGVIPDYKVQPSIQEYLSDKDVEMDFVRKLINGQ